MCGVVAQQFFRSRKFMDGFLLGLMLGSVLLLLHR